MSTLRDLPCTEEGVHAVHIWENSADHGGSIPRPREVFPHLPVIVCQVRTHSLSHVDIGAQPFSPET